MTTPTRTPEQEAHAHDPIVLSVRLTSTCPHGKRSNTCCGNAEWLRVIHSVNRVAAAAAGVASSDDLADDGHRPFGAPIATYDWWAGGWCEEYREYRVILRDDGTTNVQAKTPSAAALLRIAMKAVTGRDVDDNGMAI